MENYKPEACQAIVYIFFQFFQLLLQIKRRLVHFVFIEQSIHKLELSDIKVCSRYKYAFLIWTKTFSLPCVVHISLLGQLDLSRKFVGPLQR